MQHGFMTVPNRGGSATLFCGMKLDTLITDERLASAANWAEPASATVSLTEIDGRAAARLTEPTARLPFPATPRPQHEYNCLSFEFHLSKPANLMIVLETGLTRPAMDSPEELHTVTGILEPGWSRVAFTLSSFLPLGLSSDFRGVHGIRIETQTAGRCIALGELRGQVVRPAEGSRLTDEEFLDALDLDRPELYPVAKAHADGRTEDALAAINDHFRRRTAPKHYFHETLPPLTEQARRTADEICRGWVKGEKFQGEIDWLANPTGYQEWRTHLYYMSWALPLVSAYAGTGREEYAQRLDEIISSFIRRNSRPLDHSGGGGPWSPHRPSARVAGFWPAAFFASLEAESFTTRTRIEMLKNWWETAEHLLRWSDPTKANPRMADSQAIATCGILLPEFRRSAFWLDEGLRRLREDMQRQVRPDGVHYELAGYHAGCLDKLCRVLLLARLNAIALDPEFEQRINGMFDWLVHSVRSCGTGIAHNDPAPFRHHPSCLPYTTLATARKLNRQDVLFVTGNGGNPPKETSRAFQNTGFFLMRGGWQTSDPCLFFDGAAIGANHCHEDKLSIDVSAHGMEFIVDPGIHSYMCDRFSRYFRSSAAHNTLHIDGRSQNRLERHSVEQRTRDVSDENEWYSSHVFDYARSMYTWDHGTPGDADEASPVHERVVLFIKNEYFLVFDRVTGSGRHTIDSMLHFAPMPLFADTATRTFRTHTSGNANMEVICLPGPPTPEMQVQCGQVDPVQGWAAPDSGPACPAPVAIMSWETNLPLLTGMLLVARHRGGTAGLTVDVVDHNASAWNGVITHPDGRRDIVIVSFQADDPARPEPGVRTAVVRRNPDGSVKASDSYRGVRGN